MSTKELRKKIADAVHSLRRTHGPRGVRCGKNIQIVNGRPVSVRLPLFKSIQFKLDGSVTLLWNDPKGFTHNFPIV